MKESASGKLQAGFSSTVPLPDKINHVFRRSFTNGQLVWEDPSDADFFFRGEIAQITYSKEFDALFVELWWLAKRQVDQFGLFYWVNQSLISPELLVLAIKLPPANLSAVEDLIGKFGRLSINNLDGSKTVFHFFPSNNQDNLAFNKIIDATPTTSM